MRWRADRVRRPATCSRRWRRRLGASLALSASRTLVRSQASRSWASRISSSHVSLVGEAVEGQPREAELAGLGDAVLDARVQPVADLQRDDVGVVLVGQKALVAVSVDVGEAQLGAGVRAFLAHDQPRSLGPAPRGRGGRSARPPRRPRAACRRRRAPAATRRRPAPARRGRRSRSCSSPTRTRSGGRATRSANSCVAPALSDRARIATGSSAWRSATSAGSCASACVKDHHMVGGGVGARVAGPQHHRQRLAGAIQPAAQRMKAEAVLAMGRRALLLGMHLDQMAVEVQHDPLPAGRPAPTRVRAPPPAPSGSPPAPGRRSRAARATPSNATRSARTGRADRPARRDRRRTRRHRSASSPDRPAPDPGRASAAGDADAPAPRSDAPVTPRRAGQLGRQRRPRARHQPARVGHDPKRSDLRVMLHRQDDVLLSGVATFDKPHLPCSGGQFSAPNPTATTTAVTNRG